MGSAAIITPRLEIRLHLSIRGVLNLLHYKQKPINNLEHIPKNNTQGHFTVNQILAFTLATELDNMIPIRSNLYTYNSGCIIASTIHINGFTLT